MCFSAPASFVSSGGLAILGGATFVIAKKEEKILAIVPLLFAIQQGFEGFQWLALYNGSTSPIAGFGFLFFAFIVWPLYVPGMVYILDTEKQKTMRWFIFIGALTSLYFLTLLMTEPLGISKMQSCINYTFHFPFENYIIIPYMIAIFGPFFFSAHKFFRRFGIIALVLACVTWLFFAYAFISVWCFFAAIASTIIFFHVVQKRL